MAPEEKPLGHCDNPSFPVRNRAARLHFRRVRQDSGCWRRPYDRGRSGHEDLHRRQTGGNEPGSKILNTGGVGAVGTSNVSFSGNGYLIRRPDGTLDQVFAFLLDWSPPNQPSGQYLLAVRLRKGTGASTAYFT